MWEKERNIEAHLWETVAKKHQRGINKRIKEGLKKERKLKIFKGCFVKGGWFWRRGGGEGKEMSRKLLLLLLSLSHEFSVFKN